MSTRESRLRPLAAFAADPRHYQIAVLGSLLVYGMAGLGFEVGPLQVAATIGAALAAQLAFTRLFHLPAFEPRSALISGLSLCLLLRTGSPLLAAAAAVVAVASKFLLRSGGRHLFNPASFALVAMMVATGRVWVSPGQWGSAAIGAFLLACAGGLVVHRALRSDVTVAFLAAWVGLLFARALWLGDPLALPAHRLASGALVLFAFFMISDPKTTPDSRAGRVVFGILVAVVALYVDYRLFRPNGLLWSLVVSVAAVPLLNRLLPGKKYEWPTPPPGLRSKGAPDEPATPTLSPAAALPAARPDREPAPAGAG